MIDKLVNILKDPNDKLIAIDLDGTLCDGEFWGTGNPKVNQNMQSLAWKLYKKGAHIVIYTARQPIYYQRTLAWLIENSIPFHGIAMFYKPGADLYIDDKCLNVDDLAHLLESKTGTNQEGSS